MNDEIKLFDDGTEFKCSECEEPLEWNIEICGVCNKQNLPPNVRRAMMHKTELEKRINSLKDGLEPCEQEKLEKFKQYVEQNAKIIIAMSIKGFNRTVLDGGEPYRNYHFLAKNRNRKLAEPSNDIKRSVVDDYIHHKYKEDNICAAMSTGNTGLWGYGEVHISLKPSFF